MIHHRIAVGVFLVILVLIYFGLAWYEDRHRLECSICGGDGWIEEEGIPCNLCAGRR